MNISSHTNFLKRVRDSFQYRLAMVQNNLANILDKKIVASGLSKKDFSKKAGIKPSYLTRVLRGEQNLSLRTLVKLADAVDARVEISFPQKNVSTCTWIYLVESEKPVRKAAKASYIEDWKKREAVNCAAA